MSNPSLLFGLVYFPLTAIHLFAAQNLLKKTSSKLKLMIAALLQAATITVIRTIVPILGLQALILTITHLVYHQAALEAPLVPDALFSAIFPIVSAVIGELIFLPILARFFSPPLSMPLFCWIISLPSLLLALCFLFRPGPSSRRLNLLRHYSRGYPLQLHLLCTAAALFHSFCILDCAFRGEKGLKLCPIYIYTSLIILPVLGVVLIQSVQNSHRAQKKLRHHAQKSRLAKQSLRALQEERHDVLNELTLISSYVQMQKWEQAQACIAYTAASLAERYNYSTLPDDAWFTVLASKQKEALHRGITFAIHIDADPPLDYAELRLLPKLITNLVDNAFAAVENTPNPTVSLFWSKRPQGGRLLSVTNNGPPIPAEIRARIYEPGVSTKTRQKENGGWGLAICKKIAAELGGALEYESCELLTSFTLDLPAPSLIPPQ
ncbi:MAG: GHKL domain-containing protein [Firmicutes bacterium]|nr:GHKL domain-containing protein [Bacillota bacterium]